MIWDQKDDPHDDYNNDPYGSFDLYSRMAYFLSSKLKIRPNEILDSWGVPELIVTYGQIVNEIAQKNYATWEVSKTGDMPKRFYVRFYSGD